MSYILDALKKIEHEKNRKKLPQGKINLSGDLFLERKQPASRAGIWKIMLLIAAASLVTCAGTWFVLRGNGRKSAAVIRPATPTPIPTPPTPTSPVPVNLPVATPVVPIPPQSQPAAAVAPPATMPSAASAAPQDAASDADDDDSSERRARRSRKRVKSQPSSTQLPAQAAVQTGVQTAVQTPVDIKLSGIAWQDERAGRRAVVNGFLLKEGSVVSGSKITEIRPNKVRFSSPTGPFEIKLDAVLPAEVHR